MVCLYIVDNLHKKEALEITQMVACSMSFRNPENISILFILNIIHTCKYIIYFSVSNSYSIFPCDDHKTTGD